jgi:predicted  nucleic acid-binding Zn-ribbon protein
VPEVPSGNRNLLLYSADPSKAPSGYYGFAGTQKTSETYDGSVVYRVRSIWNGLRVNLGNLADRGLLKVGDVLTYSVAMRAEQETAIQARLFVRYTNESGAGSPTGKTEIVNLTADWQYVSVTFTVTAKMLAENTKVTYLGWELTSNAESDKYVYYACNKIERGNVATPYSQAPEDLDWSTATLVPTQQQRYLWKFEYIYYSDGSVEVAQPVNLSIAGADANTTGVSDAINQTNQTVASLQNSVSQAQSDLATVSSSLTQARQDLESSIALVDTKADTVQSNLNKTKQDLLTSISNVQSDLTSTTNRTKTVEDDLAGTKTTLSQVQTTADNANQKTVTLETGLNGLNARFDDLKIGGTNLLLYSADPSKAPNGYYQFSGATKTDETLNGSVVYKTHTIWSKLAMNWGKQLIDNPDVKVGDEFTYSVYVRTDQETPISTRLFFRYTGQYYAEGMTGEELVTQEWKKLTKTFTVTQKMLSDSSKLSWVGFEQTSDSEDGKYVYYACNKLERGNIATDYSPNEADIEQKVANYKQTADQNYASLQTTVQNLDGTVQQNKTVADQTAAGFKTRIESLETYKDGETTRANQYFESAKTETARQLTAERTAIANDYVAKSTYTEDVSGIRSDLSQVQTTANTTKTNLASYQVSNDQAVASLQSSLQTTDGNVSGLQTQINAVPGQITSAVSEVEGKIPTEIGGRNLYAISKNSGIYASGVSEFTQNVETGEISWKTASVSDSQFGEFTSTIGTIYRNVYGVKIPVVQGKDMLVSLTDDRLIKNYVMFWGEDDTLVKNTIKYTTNQFKVQANQLEEANYLTFRFGVKENTQEIGTLIKTKVKVEYGNVYTDWTPAPEDTASQISSLSSQIQQTADGMTLLATKTELNTAKTDLQSGISTATSKANAAQATADSNAQTISTHTTQISALNNGLQAKVSQSDFDSLSGRVSSAESNLTATASQLSSQISSVENKIPTTVGGTNLLLYSSDPSKAPSGYYGFAGTQKTSETYDGSVVYRVRSIWNGLRVNLGNLADRGLLKVGDVLTYSVAMRAEQETAIQARLFVRYTNESGAGSPTGKTEIVNLTADWQYVSVTFTVTAKMLAENTKVTYLGWELTSNAESDKYVYYACNKIERGNIATDYSPNPEDYDAALTQAKSEIKQTTDSITASVSSVETKADNAQTAVNTLDSEVVKSASLNLDNNGFVTKVGKTIDGNKFATMIAQNANNVKIIADEMQVTADMIVDGAVTAEKLDVNNLSAVNSDLGEIKGGSLLLQENKAAGSATDNWGTYDRPAYKQGLYMDNRAFASSGAIQRKNGGETTPTDMPLAVLQAGELRFLVVDYNDNLKNVVHYGLSDPDYGAIRFEIDSELKRRLTMTSSGYLNFQATNYTNWTSTGVSGCEYMIQGRLVLVNYDVTFNSAGTHTIGGIPQEFTKKSLMMTAKAWTITPRDKNIQLNSDGSLHILYAEANVNYRGTLVFSY